ncbi:MAG: peptidylprolyl isomerase [Peptostreptococcaceae bacterium]
MSEDKKTNSNDELISINKIDEYVEEKAETKEPVEKKIKNKNVKYIIAMTLVGVLGLGIGFTLGKDTGRKLPATSKNYSSNKVVATVGDTKFTGKDLKYRMEPLFYINAKDELTPEEVEAYESSMIDYMTTTEVLYLEGKKEGIEVTKEDVEAEYTNLLGSLNQNFGLTEDVLLNDIKIPKEQIQKDLEKELIATKYLGEESDVGEEEAKKYYDKNKDEFLTVKASHILLQTKDDEGNALSDEEKKKKEKEANSILEKAKNGVDFAALAEEYSEDGSAISGGDLGFFGRGQMVEEFENAAYGLKVGEITDKLIETDFGYHIIKKTDEKYESFDDIKEEVIYNLSYEKQSNILDNLAEKYNVTVK